MHQAIKGVYVAPVLASREIPAMCKDVGASSLRKLGYLEEGD